MTTDAARGSAQPQQPAPQRGWPWLALAAAAARSWWSRRSAGGTCCWPVVTPSASLVVAAWFARVATRGDPSCVAAASSPSSRWSSSWSSWWPARACACSSSGCVLAAVVGRRRPGSPCAPTRVGRRHRAARRPAAAPGAADEPAVGRGQGRAVRARSTGAASAASSRSCSARATTCWQLAEDAVARGADLIGMAGGDGSQALVASVASRHGIPFVVVPAGTRNHFALDLGIDRDDVVGALDAYDDGVDTRDRPGRGQRTRLRQQRVDGRVREDRPVGGVPRRQGADGGRHAARPARAGARRRSTCSSPCRPARRRPRASCCWCPTTPTSWRTCAAGAPASASTAACSASSRCGSTGLPTPEARCAGSRRARCGGSPGGTSGRPPSSRSRSGGPVEVGVDGEALVLEPPLRFAIRPGAADRPAAPRRAPGRSPAAHRAGRRQTLDASSRSGRPAHRPPGEGPMTSPAACGAGRGAARRRVSSARGDARLSGLVSAAARGSGTVDRDVYAAVAELPTPLLDGPLRRVSHFANYSKPWFLVAARSRSFGGPGGAVPPLTGVAAIGATSLVVNQPMKLAGGRRPPAPRAAGRPRDALGADADVDVVPLRSLRVGSGLRRRGRRPCCPALRVPLRAAAGGRGVLPRVHRRALPRRRRRRAPRSARRSAV